MTKRKQHKQARLWDDEVKPAPRPVWVKIRKTWPGIWEHESGWRIYHCGHPTALWPYYAMPPGVPATGAYRNEMLLSGGMGLGKGFSELKDCQAAVEKIAQEKGQNP
jgi:hypothetical protein